MQFVTAGSSDERIYFEAPPSRTGFTVHGRRAGATVNAWTTPTIVEVDATNMPGVYELVMDEQTNLTTGKAFEMLKLFIKATGWSGVSVDVALIQPNNWAVNTQLVNGILLQGIGTVANPWRPA